MYIRVIYIILKYTILFYCSSNSKFSGKWQRRRVPFGFTEQNVAVYQDTNFFSQLCRKLPPEILNDLYESSQQSGRKHKCTPLKGSIPKRKRLLSPGTPSSTGLRSPRQCPFSPLSTSCSNSDRETVLSKLKAKGLDSDFQKFIVLIKNEKFPLDNLSLLLFLETIRFFATSNTSEMRYSDITKRFWKVGYRMFHGKFLLHGWTKKYKSSSERFGRQRRIFTHRCFD